MLTVRMSFITLLILSIFCFTATDVQAFVTGEWKVAGRQSTTVKVSWKKAKKKKVKKTRDLFVFAPDGEFSAIDLQGVGAWTQNGKNYTVSADHPEIVEEFFEEAFASQKVQCDVTLQSFSITGSESKGRMKGTFSFKLYVDLLNGYYMYISTIYKFTGKSAAGAARGASRDETTDETADETADETTDSIIDLLKEAVGEVAPQLEDIEREQASER